ncbi:hypothetical protein S40285_09265 [Stachybotrys chlorohalonatus IBT 40285]|uniref:CBM1 domain-containing protein n=1 Tax=Stachybotrys chlorohalonatus (strain IBT 40285) TaxID=1283841 RepID=A0A084R0Z8_STAC4|nr:hypothetical protein S40285_09265 [Stachybotrys chlorohalonata IBT 40285]
MLAAALSLLFLTSSVAAQSGAWQQCGGVNWSGATTCISGYRCSRINDFYFQCIPGTETATTTRSSASATVTSSSRSVGSNTGTATATGSGTNPGPTLISGWYYVRGVAPPNYHSYLQAKPTGTASDAYLDAASGAGQFNIVSGQLVYYTGAGGQLYMHVENPADRTQRTLETWFERTPNTHGTFIFQGDTVTWRTSDISRPNEAAWLVCEGQRLYINTGAYGYQTPAGCADQTIHSYGGSTPDI